MIPISQIDPRQFGEDGPLYATTSQCGEDAIVMHYFSTNKPLNGRAGFYIDVGAFHPRYMSNTALLHTMGWQGINIDANADMIEVFKRERPEDISLAVGVGRERGRLPYFAFKGRPGMNTFSENFRDEVAPWAGEPEVHTFLEVMPLRDILQPHLKPGQQIDYMDIDIEGFDDIAVETYDFAGFPPSLVSVEVHGLNMDALGENRVVSLMRERGYRLLAYTINTAFFSR